MNFEVGNDPIEVEADASLADPDVRDGVASPADESVDSIRRDPQGLCEFMAGQKLDENLGG